MPIQVGQGKGEAGAQSQIDLQLNACKPPRLNGLLESVLVRYADSSLVPTAVVQRLPRRLG
jgi:hypothetical protein